MAIVAVNKKPSLITVFMRFSVLCQCRRCCWWKHGLGITRQQDKNRNENESCDIGGRKHLDFLMRRHLLNRIPGPRIQETCRQYPTKRRKKESSQWDADMWSSHVEEPTGKDGCETQHENRTKQMCLMLIQSLLPPLKLIATVSLHERLCKHP